jgi:hypothetical protein
MLAETNSKRSASAGLEKFGDLGYQCVYSSSLIFIPKVLRKICAQPDSVAIDVKHS